MQIRPAHPDDAHTIAEVHVQTWKETYTGIFPSSVLDRLDVAERAAAWQARIPDLTQNRQALSVAVVDGAMVGFAGCGPARKAELGADGEIYMINIVNRGKRRHLGTRLMLEMANALTTNGFCSAGLWVLEKNNPARAFYARLGGSQSIAVEDDHDGVKLNDLAILWPQVEILRERAAAVISAKPA